MLIASALLRIRHTFRHSTSASSLNRRMKSFVTLDKAAPTSVYLRLVTEHLKPQVEIKWDSVTSLKLQNITLHSPEAISRHLVRSNPDYGLYSSDHLEQSEIDHWVWFGLNRFGHSDYNTSIRYCNEVLAQQTYLVGGCVTIADLSVYSALIANRSWNIIMSKGLCGTNIERWYTNLTQMEKFQQALADVPIIDSTKSSAKTSPSNVINEEGGKFVDLPGASDGNVVVRFPPEAGGYLHIGHAKAALLNQYYQQTFNGKLILRFDDTNPAKESREYEEIILQDLKLLNIHHHSLSFTSNHFPKLLILAEEMIRKGLAYVDNTEPTIMKEEREQRINSKNRDNSIAQNLNMWADMKKGSEVGKACCLRAKISMDRDNGCMRDPTIYRCKDEIHPHTQDQYKVYPTYDFACPIVDSVEGVTHALRTTEYHDRNEQYYWILDQLGMRKPHIWDFARLNLTHTVLSKRNLRWFVEEGLVNGWDDPRLPTVRGVLRRGMTVECLRQFIILQGSARSVVQMSWDKIWTINKKIIDPIAPRYTGIVKASVVNVNIANVMQEEVKKCPRHPKNEDIGDKDVYYGNKALIELEDARTLVPGQMVTMINWGNMRVNSVDKEGDLVSSVSLTAELDNQDYKKTTKLTWLCNNTHNVPAVLIYYDNLLSKAVLGKDEDFRAYVGHQTQFETEIIGDPSLVSLNKGDIIQLQRKGYFICDVPYQARSNFSDLQMPCVLINIPDGRIAPKLVQQTPKIAPVTAPALAPALTPAPVTASALAPALTPALASSPGTILDLITAQGNVVRDLKSKKASKDEIKAAVDKLLALKKDYKELTGQDPQAGGKAAPAPPAAAAPAPPAAAAPAPAGGDADALLDQITVQGNAVRDLKASKADKVTVKAAVDKLLGLKKQYKDLTGQNPPPGGKPAPSPVITSAALPVTLPSVHKPALILAQIAIQGDEIRELKASKADKGAVKVAVDELLALKKQYKDLTGQDPPPGGKPAPGKIAPAMTEEKIIEIKIKEQGDKVRAAKSSNANKEVVKGLVDELLKLKADYKALTGETHTPSAPVKQQQQVKPLGSTDKKQKQKKAESVPEAGVTRLGLEAKKLEDFPNWYSQVITKSEMIEYYNVSGCYILRPWAFSIWESIQAWFDNEIKALGVENCYFPMFVSQSALEKEKSHIADFAPEVAWVTRSGDSELAEPIAIRPTSETVMYPAYADWIRSYRDLPLKLNQWCNVVRWEFKHPQPFLRTREFLWQEGHSAFATREEATEEVLTILELYYKVYKDLLAIPTVKGRKTEKEKFAGGDFTTTIEGYVAASGRAIQGGTSHHLGQNFSKMFDITFEDPESTSGEKIFVHQNSWGLTTRTIGVMVMVHGDDKGLVLPPRVAKVQVIITPCGISEANKDQLISHCKGLEATLTKAGIKVKGDYRMNYSTGWKFNHWELKGVPLRMEVGPRDMKSNQVVVVRRDIGTKKTLSVEGFEADIKALLDTIHDDMYDKALKERDEMITVTNNWEHFCSYLDQKMLIISPFCGDPSCEEKIKKESAKTEVVEEGAPSMGAKSLCIPFEQPGDATKEICVHPDCGVPAKFYTMFGRSY